MMLSAISIMFARVLSGKVYVNYLPSPGPELKSEFTVHHSAFCQGPSTPCKTSVVGLSLNLLLQHEI